MVALTEDRKAATQSNFAANYYLNQIMGLPHTEHVE